MDVLPDSKGGEDGPAGLHSSTNSVFDVLTSPWFVLLLIGIVYYCSTYIKQYLERRQRLNEDAAHHKDPDTVLAKQEAMEAARRKMQEKYDQQALAYAELQKQKAEEKRKELIQDWERHQAGQGYKSKSRVVEEPASESAGRKPASKPKLKPEYNPLMGGGGSSSFRPTGRRGAAGGG